MASIEETNVAVPEVVADPAPPPPQPTEVTTEEQSVPAPKPKAAKAKKPAAPRKPRVAAHPTYFEV